MEFQNNVQIQTNTFYNREIILVAKPFNYFKTYEDKSTCSLKPCSNKFWVFATTNPLRNNEFAFNKYFKNAIKKRVIMKKKINKQINKNLNKKKL